jgi:hypothetical protein
MIRYHIPVTTRFERMTMRQLTMISAGLALACAFAASGDALARQRHHHHRHGYSLAQGRAPLIVERRSFLDPGTVVPVGYEHNYMVQQTYFLPPDPIYDIHRNWGGAETLPRRQELRVIPYDSGLPFDFP